MQSAERSGSYIYTYRATPYDTASENLLKAFALSHIAPHFCTTGVPIPVSKPAERDASAKSR